MNFSRRLLVLLALILICTFTACTGAPASDAAPTPTPVPGETIVIPKHVAELAGVDIATLDLAAAVEKQKDGSLVYRLQPEEKSRLLADMKNALDAYLAELSADWPFVERAEPDSAYEAVTLFTQKEKYAPERDAKIAGALYAPVVLYRSFLGLETPEDFVLEILVTDASDYSILAELRYPKTETAGTDKTGDE